MKRTLDILFFLAGTAVLALFTTRYLMPFRLDDVLLMQWAQGHSLLDAFDPIRGQMINSFRPIFSVAAYLLTHFAGWDHPVWWHLTLDLSLMTGITFTGLTARYLTGRWYALEISALLYWIAFLPILNIFFWYSDLTFGLELAFTASAWYFSLRGLYEARIRFWIIGMVLGTLAVLSKEPAFVLVHLVIVGSFLLERNEIIPEWKASKQTYLLAISSYAVLLAITLWVAFISPTKSNRFFTFNTHDLPYFVRDRIQYYSAVYFSVSARILLFFPIVYAFLRTIYRKPGVQLIYLTVLSLVSALLLFQNIGIGIPLLVFLLLRIGTVPNVERDRVRKLFPFLACLFLAIVALLFTIQLVKTQLTEAALLTSILSAWAWTVWVEDARQLFDTYQNSSFTRWVIGFGIIIAVALVLGMVPKARKEEHLLREVRAVRENANDAVEWAAKNLPTGSLLAVTDYQLYGIDGPYAITGKDDETKLAEQYTFAGGFVFDALGVLGRSDFQRTFMRDSALVPHVLDAMRERPNSFVLLQSKLDLDLFHRSYLLHASDSLSARFAQGPYSCEIWKLKN